MTATDLHSPRLRLVPSTSAIITADLTGHTELEAVLGVTVPASWPPEYYDTTALHWTLRQLEDPTQHGWSSFYLVADNALVGLTGFKGPPDESGTVEIGYGLVPEAQGHGYATEAANALIDQALRVPAVGRIIAETLPALGPSIRVLERCGFRLIGQGSERGVIRFELTRADAEAGRREIPAHRRTLVRLQGHMAWANQQALNAIAGVEGSREASLAMLGHILGAEHVWLSRISGEIPTTAVWPELNLSQASTLALENELRLRVLVGESSPDDLRRNVTYRTSAGDEFVSTVEDILVHLFLHGAYHRGQIAQQQRLNQQAPGPSDYIAFTRGAPAAIRTSGATS